jgi:hypothetical protein
MSGCFCGPNRYEKDATALIEESLPYPSVVKGGDDNLIVYLANCIPGSVRIQNEDEFIEEMTKIVARRGS